MEYITWEAEFDTGHKDIDAQHQIVIGYINDLHELLKKNTSRVKEELIKILEGLSHYTRDHFELEEKLMIESGFPGYENHKKDHQSFNEKLEKFTSDLQIDHSKVLYQAISYLKFWFTSHTLYSDKRLVTYLKSLETQKVMVSTGV